MTSADPPEHRLVVGLEVHARLRTRTKCFCPCPAEGQARPNSRTCPTCLGLPGALPVLSRQALALTVRVAVALSCGIAETTWWDRKHYGYADLPKGYQITQHAAPVGTAGVLAFDVDGAPREVAVRRVHLEEDTGRSLHGDDGTRLDFDRAGAPLVEIVTEPGLSTPDEVAAALTELRRLLRWTGVSEADMENGAMRCEPNVNVHVRTDEGWVPTPIAELKNLNSISAAARAVEHERARQIRALLDGGPRGPRPRTTRGWNDTARRTEEQRVKEEAADYRFLPEPDLPVVTRCREIADDERATLPELPRTRRARYVDALGLSRDVADVLTASRPLGEWYERAAEAAGDARDAVAAWVVGDVLRWADDDGTPTLDAAALGALVREVERGRVPRDAARRVLLPAMAGGEDWDEVVRRDALDAASDDEVASAVHAAVAARPDLVARARAGHEGVVDVLVGAVMEATRGRADGAHVRSLVRGIVTGISDSGAPGSLGEEDEAPEV